MRRGARENGASTEKREKENGQPVEEENYA